VHAPNNMETITKNTKGKNEVFFITFSSIYYFRKLIRVE
jgi:hypothetical protein